MTEARTILLMQRTALALLLGAAACAPAPSSRLATPRPSPAPTSDPSIVPGRISVTLRRDASLSDFEAIVRQIADVQIERASRAGEVWGITLQVPAGLEREAVERLRRDAEALVQHVGTDPILVPR